MATDDQRRGQGGEPDGGTFATSRRIAGGTSVRAIGEVVAKLANVVFFIAIARELGDEAFGAFIFGISFASIMMLAAGFGTDELVTREVAKDKRRVHLLFKDVVAAKAALMVVLLGAMVAVVLIGNYSSETEIAVLLIGIGTALEYLAKSVHAVFQAYEQMQYIAATLIIQRLFTATIGTVIVLQGGGLVAASAILAVGGALGLVAAVWVLHRKVVRPQGTVDTTRWAGILKAGAPLGVMILLYIALIKLDATLLSFLKDNEAVGHYGAAFRLIDATMFLSWSFGAAILPWFATQRDDSPVSLSRGYELGLKAMITILLPIGIAYAVFAEPMIELLYGSEYDAAVDPLRLLGAMTVLFGINTFVSIVLIARNRPSEFTWPAVIVFVQNIAFNLILIPRYGASGAAFNAVLSGALLALLTVGRVGRRMGHVSFIGALTSPALAGAAMAGAGLALSAAGLHWVLAATLATIAFAAAFLLVERLLFPDDFKLYSGMLRFRERMRREQEPVELPPEVAAEGRLDL
jgi:O-antigen/teichoic acid export membrane protein